jgi:hypothetical protein
VAGSYGNGNEPSGSIKDGQFLDYRSVLFKFSGTALRGVSQVVSSDTHPQAALDCSCIKVWHDPTARKLETVKVRGLL